MLSLITIFHLDSIHIPASSRERDMPTSAALIASKSLVPSPTIHVLNCIFLFISTRFLFWGRGFNDYEVGDKITAHASFTTKWGFSVLNCLINRGFMFRVPVQRTF